MLEEAEVADSAAAVMIMVDVTRKRGDIICAIYASRGAL